MAYVGIVLTVLLIEPSLVLRQSLRSWLEVNLAPGAILEAEDLPRALAPASTPNPRIILLDLDALVEIKDDIQRLKAAYPQAVIIGMGLDDTPAHRQRAEAAGVAAFVSKSQLNGDLINAIRTTLSGTFLL